MNNIMDCYDNVWYSVENQKRKEFLKIVIKAVKMTREVSMLAEYKCRKLNEVIDSNDKEKMWVTLQEYIHNYPELFSGVYGIVIVHVTEDFLATRLNIVKGLMYLNEAMHCAAKETIKSCLKNLLKKSGIFSNKEIETLLL